MSSRLGPDYACLFVGYVEERMLSSYIGIKKGLFKWYMDDVDGAVSCGEQDLRQFLEFASSFTLTLTDKKTSSLELIAQPLLYITRTQIATLTSTSVHPNLTVASHPYLIVSFSDCIRSVVMTLTLTLTQQKWRPFLQYTVIQVTPLEGEENQHLPNQGLKF